MFSDILFRYLLGRFFRANGDEVKGDPNRPKVDIVYRR